MENYIMIDGVKVNLSDETLKEMKAKLGIKDKVSVVPEFEVGDKYWCILANGKINWSYWEKSIGNQFKLKTGNAYKTEEEAKKKLEYLNHNSHPDVYLNRKKEIDLKMTWVNEWLIQNGDVNVDWNSEDEEKYCVCYDYVDCKWDWCYTYGRRLAGVVHVRDFESVKELC